MDMTSVDEVVITSDPDLWRPGDTWLAGGTVLYSYGTDIARGNPTRLLDITDAGWPALRWGRDADGESELEIAATCRIAELYAFARRCASPEHGASPALVAGRGDRNDCGTMPEGALPGLDLFRPCCDSFVASWKIWNLSTVGGNVATALPAGPMTSLLSGLDATARVFGPGGSSRVVAVADLVTGDATTDLADGEIIRSFHIPVATLRHPCAFRRLSLTHRGRSAALVIGRRTAQDRVRLAVTAATPRPCLVDVHLDADADELHHALQNGVHGRWHDDVHGSPEWREQMTCRSAEEIVAELRAISGPNAPVGEIPSTTASPPGPSLHDVPNSGDIIMQRDHDVAC